jgi:hypothetical protein
MDQFSTQQTGSGDLLEPKKRKRKVQLLTFNKFLELIQSK